MALVTPTQVREHVPTDLVDAALQRVIDAVEEFIVEAVGDLDVGSEEFQEEPSSLLYLRRPALSLTGVTEYWGTDVTVLASNDYELRGDGRELARLSTGTNASDVWGNRVIVTYVPKANTMQRILATIDLVRLAVNETGLASASDGDHSESRLNIAQERRRIIETLKRRHRMFV
jgi:hypothetical protein